MTYTVFFQIYGKRMKVEVEAISKSEAIQKVKDAVKIDKVESNNPFNYDANNIMDFLNGFRK